MAEAVRLPATPEIRERWGAFAWTAENAEKAKTIVARYPPGRQQSAVIPLLDLAQRQIGAETGTQGWLPIPVIEFVAARTGHALYPRLRGRDLLHDVQPRPGRPPSMSRSAAPRPACCAARTS